MGLRRFKTVVCSLVFLSMMACGVHVNSAKLLIATNVTPGYGVVGSAYSVSMVATGGIPPYIWSVASGSLPAGLSLNSKSGVLSGTPTTAGTSTFAIQVKDSGAKRQVAMLSTTLVIASVLAITSDVSLPSGVAGDAYSATFQASGGTPSYSWTVLSGTLPAGLTMSSAGVVSGTPTVAGTSTFTVEAVDSAVPAQTSAFQVTLTVNPPLAVTTTMLVPGVVNAGYSAALSAIGGLAPYTWSVDPAAPLPAPLMLSSSGEITGTPAAASNSNVGFIVTDSANNRVEVKLNLTISNGTDSTYAFLFSGTSPQGTPAVENGFAIAGEFTVQNGVVISGYYDENANTSLTGTPPALEQPITGGSLTLGTNGLSSLVLDVANGGVSSTLTFALATPPSAGPGKSSAIRIIGFGDNTGIGIRGSGVLRPSTPGAISATPGSSFAFLIAGADSNQTEQALIGSFQTDGAGNLVSGMADANQLGGLAHWSQVSGNYAIDANGRGLLRIGLGPNSGNSGDFSFAFYEVSPAEWLIVSVDPVTSDGPLAAGSVLQQTGSGSFSVASIPAAAVVETSGIMGLSSGTTPDIAVGLATSDGSGNVTYSFDEYAGSFNSGQSLGPVNYAVDPTTGRAASTGATDEPILYLIDSSSTKTAFVLSPVASALSGILETQSGGPYTNASFSGNYLGGSLPLNSPTVLNEAGLVSADGDGNFTFTSDRSSSEGLVSNQSVSGSYVVAADGRVVATTPDGVTRIFYMVAPGKVAYLTSDGGGYLGEFEQ